MTFGGSDVGGRPSVPKRGGEGDAGGDSGGDAGGVPDIGAAECCMGQSIDDQPRRNFINTKAKEKRRASMTTMAKDFVLRMPKTYKYKRGVPSVVRGTQNAPRALRRGHLSR